MVDKHINFMKDCSLNSSSGNNLFCLFATNLTWKNHCSIDMKEFLGSVCGKENRSNY